MHCKNALLILNFYHKTELDLQEMIPLRFTKRFTRPVMQFTLHQTLLSKAFTHEKLQNQSNILTHETQTEVAMVLDRLYMMTVSKQNTNWKANKQPPSFLDWISKSVTVSSKGPKRSPSLAAQTGTSLIHITTLPKPRGADSRQSSKPAFLLQPL